MRNLKNFLTPKADWTQFEFEQSMVAEKLLSGYLDPWTMKIQLD
jgi:hypothetical protein